MNVYFAGVWDFISVLIVLLFALLVLKNFRAIMKRIPSAEVRSVWEPVYFVAVAIAVFSISRCVGHAVKFVLINMGRADLWKMLAPYSGSINTITFAISATALLMFASSLARIRGKS